MSMLVVIPARLSAVRLPRKPLRDLAGCPLIVRVWQRVSAMGVGQRLVVATDHESVAEVARAAGAEVVLTDSALASGTERVAAVAGIPGFQEFDSFLNVQGDEPFIGPAAVHGAAAMVTGGGFELGTAAARGDPSILESPSVVKVVADEAGRALYFSRAPIPYLRDEADRPELAPLTLQHIGVYSYTRAALERWAALPPHPLEKVERLEQLRPLAHGMSLGVAVVNEPPEAGIDTEDDLQKANARWATFNGENGR